MRGVRVSGVRRPQQERFLPGLEKLGLSHLPPAVAAAQYHYLSIDRRRLRRIHVRVGPQGLDPLSAAALDMEGDRDLRRARRGFTGDVARLHANNGVALGNPGSASSVPTKCGRPGWARGYYCDTTRRSRSISAWCSRVTLKAPPFDASKRPALPVVNWPKPRLEKAHRNYAMEYVRTAAPVMVQAVRS